MHRQWGCGFLNRLRTWILIGLGLLGVSAAPSNANVHPASDPLTQLDRVKAVFVLNIAKFVRWPEDTEPAPAAPLTLCNFRENVLGPAYDLIDGRSIAGRQLQHLQISEPGELKSCDILLLSEQGIKTYNQSSLLSTDSPLLVIADMTAHKSTGKAYPGVHVALVRMDSRIGFEINLAAANRAGLKFSSRLLKLARIVGEDT